MALFPAPPSYIPGLLGEEEAQRLQAQARQSGLLSLGLNLLAAGGPSAVPVGIGQALAGGLQAGQQAYQNVYSQRLQEMELARKIAEQRRQEQMRQLSGSIIQRTPGQPAQFAEESDGNVQIGQMPTAGGLQLDPQRLMALAALSDNPLAALKTVPEIVQGMRKAGLAPGGMQQEVSPFAVFLASDNQNIKAIAQQYDRAYKSGQIDDQQTGRAIEAMARMAETAGKPIADIASYENYRKQEVAEGRIPKSYEDFLINLRRSGAITIDMTSGEKGFKNEMDLRKEWQASPEYKSYVDMKSAWDSVQTALKENTPIGDTAAATKIMKLLDPGSVVRESELAIAMQATGALDRVRNYADSIIKGTKLTGAQKQEFGRLADQLYNAAAQVYNAKRDSYISIAEDYGLNAQRIAGKPAQVQTKSAQVPANLVDMALEELKRRRGQ